MPRGSAKATTNDIDGQRVRLLSGDFLLVERAVKAIQEEWVGADPLFGALDVLHGDRVDIEQLSTALKVVSLAGKRLVVLRHAERLKEESQREVLALCAEVPEGTLFVLLAEAPDLRRSLFAGLRKAGCLEAVGPSTKDARKSLPEWKAVFESVAKQKGLRFEPEARATALDQLIGDTGRLESELEKLSLRHGSDEIGIEEVLVSLGGEKSRTAFALSGAIRERRMGRALVELRTALGQGAPPEIIIGEMAGEFRALLRARALLDQGLGEAAARKAFGGGRGYFVVPKARNYRQGELVAMISELSRIDVRAKRGVDPRAPIEALFLAIGQRRLAEHAGS